MPAIIKTIEDIATIAIMCPLLFLGSYYYELQAEG